MKLLMLSKDAKIFNKGSAVRARMIGYGKLFDLLRIIVVSKGKFGKEQLSQNVIVDHEPMNNILENIWKVISGISTEAFGNIDIITAQDPFEIGAIAYRMAKKLNVPLQFQVHTDIFSKYFDKNFKNFLRRKMARMYIPKAHCIRVVSQKIKDSLVRELKISEKKITVLPIFIDAQKIKNAQPILLQKRYDFIVMWVGRLEPEKNAPLALEAFSKFIKIVPNAGLVIAGDGSGREALKLQIINYKLQENILFLGWQNDIVGYYKNADALLVTSLYEGYGMSMVEARIIGIPVIAPDVGVAKEIGAYITDYTADSIARMLMQLYENKLPKCHEYEYPYENKERYLELYKESFELCLLKDKKK